MIRRERSDAAAPGGRGIALFFLVVSLLILAYAFLVNPLCRFLPPCRFRTLTGLGCPTCGVTRSLHALTHGDLRAAWEFHPLGPAIGFVLAALAVLLLGKVLLARRLNLNALPRFPNAGWWIAVGLGLSLWFGIWIARVEREVRASRRGRSEAPVPPPNGDRGTARGAPSHRSCARLS